MGYAIFMISRKSKNQNSTIVVGLVLKWLPVGFGKSLLFLFFILNKFICLKLCKYSILISLNLLLLSLLQLLGYFPNPSLLNYSKSQYLLYVLGTSGRVMFVCS